MNNIETSPFTIEIKCCSCGNNFKINYNEIGAEDDKALVQCSKCGTKNDLFENEDFVDFYSTFFMNGKSFSENYFKLLANGITEGLCQNNNFLVNSFGQKAVEKLQKLSKEEVVDLIYLRLTSI